MSRRRQVMLNSLLVQIDTLDPRHNSVEEFHTNSNYLHSVEVVKNNGLWPVEILVRSTLPTPDQLSYLRTGASQKWEFSASVLPDGSFTEQSALVDCLARVSGKEQITTTFNSDSGFLDRMTIEVRIKDTVTAREEETANEIVPQKK
jgi:hypothetical protein